MMQKGGNRLPWLPIFALLLASAMFTSLGVWQVHRLAWKRDLIARIEARIHAQAADAPGTADWASVSAAHDAYRRVRVTGTFLNDLETLVQAVTIEGAGDWVMTPLRTDRGFTVLINRGFVPADSQPFRVTQPIQVTGLLRMTEPGGGFLRRNDPIDNRWYSRDVAAIARARHLTNVAPYFIDADKSPSPGDFPVGGLTVVNLPNNHLVYALTWFAMAALTLFGFARCWA
jgi:surfeit locus 1 family protein